MYRLKSPNELSNINDIHIWLNKCSEAVNSGNSYIILDLLKLTWVSPLGCTVLLSTLDKLTEEHKLAVIVPKNDDVIGYLTRMRFFELCPLEIRRQFEVERDMEYFYDRNINDLSLEIVELNKTEKDEDITSLAKHIFKIMKDKNLPPSICSDIMSYISELGSNATEHGGTICYSAVQYYPKVNEISISISDIGQGIYNTLSPNLQNKGKEEVIKAAIYTDATRYKDEKRGKGLMDVKRRIFRSQKGRFTLRTHDTSYTILEDRLVTIDEGNWFFGTFFHICI